MIPQVDFFGTQVTRLIVGDNPFSGHSYIPDIANGNEMMDYYTAEKIVQTLFEAEKAGYNTYLPLACPFIQRVIRQYRNEGGTMKLIFQPYPPINLDVNLRQMMDWNPIAIYHQGTTTDYMVENGMIDELKDNIKRIKDAGVPVGLGTHVPETILRAEEEDWGVDFYMSCLYNARRTQRGEESGFITGKSKQLVFYPADRFLMYDVIQKVKKPFIVFKILAGGQVFYGKEPSQWPQVVEDVFTEVFTHMKSTDIAAVGVFQKNSNQIKEDADIIKRVLAGK